MVLICAHACCRAHAGPDVRVQSGGLDFGLATLGPDMCKELIIE
jgi:hypothetical protein